MYLFQTEFYKYSPAYFDEISILENEGLNNSYLIKTKELLKDTNYCGQLVLGFYRNNWYPLILPMGIKDEKDLGEFAKILSEEYFAKPLIISDLFKHLSIENELEKLDIEQTKQLNTFTDALKKISQI